MSLAAVSLTSVLSLAVPWAFRFSPKANPFRKKNTLANSAYFPYISVSFFANFLGLA